MEQLQPQRLHRAEADEVALDGMRSLATSLPLNATLPHPSDTSAVVWCAESFREHCSQRIKDSDCAHSRVRPGAVIRGAHSFLRRKA